MNIFNLLSGPSELTEEDGRRWIDSLKRELNELESSTPVIQLDVSVDEKLMKAGCDQVQKSFFVKSEHCNPSDYKLVVSSRGSKNVYLNIHILASGEAYHQSNYNQLQLKLESSTLTEITSVQDLILSEKTVKPNNVFYPVRSVINGETVVSVTVMGKHIVSSPIIVNIEDENAGVDETNTLRTFSLAVDNHYEKEECST